MSRRQYDVQSLMTAPTSAGRTESIGMRLAALRVAQMAGAMKNPIERAQFRLSHESELNLAADTIRVCNKDKDGVLIARDRETALALAIVELESLNKTA